MNEIGRTFLFALFALLEAGRVNESSSGCLAGALVGTRSLGARWRDIMGEKE